VFKISGSGFWISGEGFRVQGSGFRVRSFTVRRGAMALPVRKDPNGDVAVKVQRTRPLAEVTIQPCFAVKTNL
jgi:hypothetical protein